MSLSQPHEVYNQGNNRQQLFFSEENYLYFLWKMRAYLLPFGDLVVYCLMPNHFHWLFFVRKLEILHTELQEHMKRVEGMRSKGMTRSHAFTKTSSQSKSEGMTDSHTLTRRETLNESIGILLRSYTRAINKQQKRSGSLFRKKCKAKDGWIDEFVTLTDRKGKRDYRFLSGTDYAWLCLNYIHENPQKAGMVKSPEKMSQGLTWSQTLTWKNYRKGSLCNLALGKELISIDNIRICVLPHTNRPKPIT
ncbi:MAG: hypothetical protein GY705_20380 [Bacteroidetes bacterium]|nr:hypothetical protein [Bacteroidota bacterium]